MTSSHNFNSKIGCVKLCVITPVQQILPKGKWQKIGSGLEDLEIITKTSKINKGKCYYA